MAELADAADSKSADLRVLGVRLPLPAPNNSNLIACLHPCPPSPASSKFAQVVQNVLIRMEVPDESRSTGQPPRALYRIFFPNAESANSTAKSAVWLCSSI